MLSVLDLKDTFHSLRLIENSKRYCGILLYFGSASYLYQRMPIGLNIPPAIWQSYINAILDCFKYRKCCKAIMDNLFYSLQQNSPLCQARRFIEGNMQKPPLKISPKKCQLFKTESQYIRNTIFIEDRRVCVKPLKSRLEAIQKLKSPTTIKGCRSFTGMIYFVSILPRTSEIT